MATKIREGFVQPKMTMIGRNPDTEKLYALEEKRRNAIELAAEEHGRVLGFDTGRYWTHTLPHQLLSVLDSYEPSSSLMAAKAFLEYHGHTVTLND